MRSALLGHPIRCRHLDQDLAERRYLRQRCGNAGGDPYYLDTNTEAEKRELLEENADATKPSSLATRQRIRCHGTRWYDDQRDLQIGVKDEPSPPGTESTVKATTASSLVI